MHAASHLVFTTLLCAPRRKLSSSPTKDSSVKLPRSIDWDLLAEEEADAEMFAGASPSQDHVRNALQTPNLGVLDELGRKLDTRPSAAFMTPGRDSALSERSTQAPESGRYNPKLHATQRRSPAITILDRSLLRKKVEYDEKKFIIGVHYNFTSTHTKTHTHTHYAHPSSSVYFASQIVGTLCTDDSVQYVCMYVIKH